jgi:hypothetical protein
MAPKGRPRGSRRDLADWSAACAAVLPPAAPHAGLAVAREDQRALAVRRPRDERAVARQWKRGSEGMPMFDDALVSDHAHGRGLLVPFVPMPWFNKMNVFFGESLSVGADGVEMKLAREFFYGSEHHKSLTVEAEERGDSREQVRRQRLQFASAFCAIELARRSALEATIASLPRETYELVLYVDYEKYDETAMSVTTSDSRLQPRRRERPAHDAPAPFAVAVHLDMSAIALPQTDRLMKERGPTVGGFLNKY